jgi:putative addiction module component (TIGR02574 family)
VIAASKLRSLPMAERLRLVGDLWDSISEEQEALPDHPGLLSELRARKARFKAKPSTAIPWEEVKRLLRSGRG